MYLPTLLGAKGLWRSETCDCHSTCRIMQTADVTQTVRRSNCRESVGITEHTSVQPCTCSAHPVQPDHCCPLRSLSLISPSTLHDKVSMSITSPSPLATSSGTAGATHVPPRERAHTFQQLHLPGVQHKARHGLFLTCKSQGTHAAFPTWLRWVKQKIVSKLCILQELFTHLIKIIIFT